LKYYSFSSHQRIITINTAQDSPFRREHIIAITRDTHTQKKKKKKSRWLLYALWNQIARSRTHTETLLGDGAATKINGAGDIERMTSSSIQTVVYSLDVSLYYIAIAPSSFPSFLFSSLLLSSLLPRLL
jgi:hypothetical protein